MKFFFLILFSFPLLLTADTGEAHGGSVQCSVLGLKATCEWDVSESGSQTDSEITMTRENCEALKREVRVELDRIKSLAVSSLSDVSNAITAAENMAPVWQATLQDLSSIKDGGSLQNQYQSTPAVSNAIDNAYNNAMSLALDLNTVGTELYSVEDNLREVVDECDQGIDRILEVVCVDQTCSGSGTGSVSCPCAEQFNTVLQRMDQYYPSLFQAVDRVRNEAAAINSAVTNMADAVEQIRSRMLSPDDRMWSELTDIFRSINTTNLIEQVRKRQVSIDDLFYNLRHVINDHDGSGDPMFITTEGVVQLYGVASQMLSLSMHQESLKEFDRQFGIFSNTVYRLFQNFNRLLGGAVRQNDLYDALRGSGTSPWIHDAMTNTSENAFQRFRSLMSDSNGKQTNWFARIEIYLQALNGWFDSHDNPLAEAVPEHVTSVQNDIDESTNMLFEASVSVSNILLNVKSIGADMKEALTRLTYQAELPETLTFFPEVEILGVEFECVFETEGIKPYLDGARIITTLMWGLIFWSFVVFCVSSIVYAIAKCAMWLFDYFTNL